RKTGCPGGAYRKAESEKSRVGRIVMDQNRSNKSEHPPPADARFCLIDFDPYTAISSWTKRENCSLYSLAYNPFLSSSSSCVPRSTISPLSTTTITSAARMV